MNGNLFDNLPNLWVVELYNNICINTFGEYDNITALAQTVSRQCGFIEQANFSDGYTSSVS